MIDNVEIRVTQSEDLEDLLAVEREAFGSEEEADLVRALLDDPSAEPVLSLMAKVGKEPAGHILFTRADFEPALEIKGSILGPLAVTPNYQKKGIGGKLVQDGLRILAERGVDWVFVLGYESYYPRYGFQPALEQGFEPPYPIASEFSNAWMALALTPTCIAPYRGKVIPAKTFDNPNYWRE